MRTLSAPVTVMSMDGLNAVDDKRTMFRKEKEKKKTPKTALLIPLLLEKHCPL